MHKRFLTIAAIGFVLIGTNWLSAQEKKDLNVTILYDNYVYEHGDKALQADWGFGCLVTGMEKTIVFDTGRKGPVFLNNCDKLQVDFKKVDVAVISHNHDDHVGGLLPMLEKNGNISVYLPPSCEKDYIQQLEARGAKVTVVTKPVEICKHVWITAPVLDEVDKVIEQSLVIDTPKGLVVIAGCSHPGMARMTRQAKEELKRDVYMVFGGTHLSQRSDAEVQRTITELKELGVKRIGTTHCTGSKVAAFQKAFGDGYLPMGAGRVLKP
jgi:7,8-dihydropterin-6-yl-methyl-4-(beta-D-ribofuranosyl)aminobenzene 5'-phosphate synthase